MYIGRGFHVWPEDDCRKPGLSLRGSRALEYVTLVIIWRRWHAWVLIGWGWKWRKAKP